MQVQHFRIIIPAMADGHFIFGEVRLDGEGRIDEAVACLHCGRQLAGEFPDVACPGCGKPIEDSIARDLLRFQSPAWLNRLMLGVAIIMLGVVLGLVFGGFRLALFTGRLPDIQHINLVVWDLIMMAPLIVTACGVWVIALRRPMDFEAESPLSIRRIAQWTAGGVVALASSYVLMNALISDGGAILGMRTRTKLPWIALVHGVWIVSAWAGHMVGRQIALRAPDVRLARWLGRWAWVAAATLVLVYADLDVKPVLASLFRPSGTLADESLNTVYGGMYYFMIAVNLLAAPVALGTLAIAGWLLGRIFGASRRYAALSR